MNRSQTSLGVQRDFVERLNAAIDRFAQETGVRVSKTAFLEKLLNDSGYAEKSHRTDKEKESAPYEAWTGESGLAFINQAVAS